MTETVATPAAQSQQAHGGLHPFFGGAQGELATSKEAPHPRKRPRKERASEGPSEEEICEAGESFLAGVFGPAWERHLQSSRLDAVLAAPLDHEWVLRRVERLKPLSDGPMRLIPKLIWDLSTVLAQPDWFNTWMELALRCPREWLVQFCGVAMLDRDGGARSLDSRRVQSMLALGVLTWQLAEYDPSDPRYPYVIRGLPYGAWQHLLAYWQRYADGPRLRVPGSTTLFGTHIPGGAWWRSECGYIKAWCRAGIAKTLQPNGKAAAPGMAGKWRKNQEGEWERWAFLEVRLRVEVPGLAPLAMGPPSPPQWRKLPPPPATGELDALVNELERSWYTDEEPTPESASALQELAAEAQRGAIAELAVSGDYSCSDLQVPARDGDGCSAQPTHEPQSLGLDVWAPKPIAARPGQPSVERTSLEAAELSPRELLQWLRTRRPGELLPSASKSGTDTDLVAASTLELGAVQATSSAKFLGALHAYDVEKQRREHARAEPKKRKPPS